MGVERRAVHVRPVDDVGDADLGNVPFLDEIDHGALQSRPGASHTPLLDGLRATETILADPENTTRVILLTTYDQDAYVHRALHAGASGFLLKSLPPEELVAAVRVAARGDAFIDPSVTRRLLTRLAEGVAPPSVPVGLEHLTSRERDVLLLLAEAYTNAEIADRLGIGDETVKSHVSRILTKLNLRDRVQAVAYAHLHGLVKPASPPPAPSSDPTRTTRDRRRRSPGGPQN